jgi:hypothetical protein
MEETIDELSTNKLMTLDDARVELESDGLSCDFVGDERLVGVSSTCRWEITARMDVVVFIQKVQGVLTHDRFLADLKLLPSWVEQLNVGANDCPPFGYAHSRHVMLVYYADTVEPVFGYEIRHVAWPAQGCVSTSTFVAAQDAQGQSFYLVEASRPLRGCIFYPERRYFAQKLTGAKKEHLQPPPSLSWVTIYKSLNLCLIILICILMPWLISIYVVPQLLIFLVALIVQWYQKCKSKNKSGVYGRLELSVTDTDNCDDHKV